MNSEALPKQFLSSLRILFDILDENRTGLIHLEDIESRWSDDGVRGLPPGVVDGLRKVTPPNGLLSFDRFVAGLKLVLIKRKDNVTYDGEMRKPLSSKENHFSASNQNVQFPSNQSVRHTTSALYMGSNQGNKFPFHTGGKNERDGHVPDQSLYRNNQSRQREDALHAVKRYDARHHSDSTDRGSSIPSPIRRESSPTLQTTKEGQHPSGPDGHRQQFQAWKNSQQFQWQAAGSQGVHARSAPEAPPTLPPRSDRPVGVSLQQSRMRKSQSGPDLSAHLHSPPSVPPRQASSRGVIMDLKNWQASNQLQRAGPRAGGPSNDGHPSQASNKDGIYANLEDFRVSAQTQQSKLNTQQDKQQAVQPGRPTVRRHGSGRRHTLSNGIDQNMLRRMKQLEEETSILHAGLTMLDSARDWYNKQLATVADKQAMLGKVSYNDNSVEAYQERMNFQRARIAEVNQHLKTLIESSEKGFPLHMNLAMPSGFQARAAQGIQDSAHAKQQVQTLREHNTQLLQEISSRRDQVGQLEREKASLVRELFEARAKNRPSHDDTTFM